MTLSYKSNFGAPGVRRCLAPLIDIVFGSTSTDVLLKCWAVTNKTEAHNKKQVNY
jgi:hypothetical protein